jgi:hypothetical protein
MGWIIGYKMWKKYVPVPDPGVKKTTESRIWISNIGILQSQADPFCQQYERISGSAFALGGQGRGAAEADAVLHLRFRLQGEDHQRDADRPRACRDHQVSLFFISAPKGFSAHFYGQCCASRILLFPSRIRLFSIPDPTFFHPGSEFFPSRIPDPHERIQVF